MRYFFYGTLLDDDVRSWILGDWVRRQDLLPAILPNHRRVYLRSRNYPVAVPARGHDVEGLLAPGLDRRATANLAEFESDEYVQRERTVIVPLRKAVRARVFLASRLSYPTGRDWQLSTWQSRHKDAFARKHKVSFFFQRLPCGSEP